MTPCVKLDHTPQNHFYNRGCKLSESVYDTTNSEGERMHSEEEQAMLERQQMLEEALERAEAGVARWDDWDIIRFECGTPRRPVVIFKTVSIRSESWV